MASPRGAASPRGKKGEADVPVETAETVTARRKERVDDLCMIENPTDQEIARQLGQRYAREIIYTNVGDVLISINPYKALPITGVKHINMYRFSSATDAPPHVFGLAENAYRRLVDDRQSQAIIISGESGAGKTVAAKFIMEYITAVSPNSGVNIGDAYGPPSVNSEDGYGMSADFTPVDDGAFEQAAPADIDTRIDYTKKIIIESNPLTEAFGNAKTIRNDNSSRFGKYIEIQFDDEDAPVGGVVSTFLLEKTRVCFQQANERNFHIFYQLLAGAPTAVKQKLLINMDAKRFHYLSQSGCTAVRGVDDAALFEETTHAMTAVGITEGDQAHIWHVIAGILHVGNIVFSGAEAPATIEDARPLDAAARCLGLEPQILKHSLVHRKIESGSVRSTEYAVPMTAVQASAVRDGLAKSLYSRLFDQVIAKINHAMHYAGGGDSRVIGVLDIYGFEIFPKNSFEQFCINYVNEKLQQVFIDLTVRKEQEEYKAQGVKWNQIDFFDNKIVCDLIEALNPPGIMRILDDTCRQWHPDDSDTLDSKFMERLYEAQATNKYMDMEALHKSHFTVHHYAGDVKYDMTSFCFKNKDSVYVSLVECMQTSETVFMRSLFPEKTRGNRASPASSGTTIRVSANRLVKRLSQCTPHYIRCIKPNDNKTPMGFDMSRVTFQAKYLGLLENVRVRANGFSYRHLIEVFMNRFGPLMERSEEQPQPTVQEFVAWITAKDARVGKNEFHIGRDKIFVRSPQTIWMLENRLMKQVDRAAYDEKQKLYAKNKKLADKKASGKHAMKGKCGVM